jgi:cell division protein FtsW
MILVRGVHIINKAGHLFEKILGVGIITMILSQAVLNMGVVTGSLPITGIPLPFISYGGSHLITCLAGIGILLNISRENSSI